MKLKKILLASPLLAFLFFTKQATAQTLVLYHANGTTTDIELYTRPIITFTNEKVLVSSPVLTLEYPKEDVMRFSYKGTVLGITSPSADTVYYSESGRLIFHNIPLESKLAVYTISGIRVPVHITTNGTDASIFLDNIPSGVYLLSINGKSYKFSKP